MVGFPIINRQLFGERAPLGSIYSFEMLGASTGMALGGWLGGVLFDVSGAYTWAIIVSAAIGYLGLPLALYLPRHRKSVVSRADRLGGRDARGRRTNDVQLAAALNQRHIAAIGQVRETKPD